MMVVFVAAALCADRAVSSAPNLRVLESPTIRQMAGRLILSIRKTIPDAIIASCPAKASGRIADMICRLPAGFRVHVPIIAMRYRLPPPPLFG